MKSNTSEYSEEMLRRVKVAETILSYKRETLLSIVAKYDILASIELGKLPKELMFNNLDMYSVLLIPIIFKCIYYVTMSDEYKAYRDTVPNIAPILENKNERDKFFIKYGRLAIENGAKIDDSLDLNENFMIGVLNSFSNENNDCIDIEDADILDDDTEEIFEEVKKNSNDIDDLRDTWGEKLEPILAGIMASYRSLYQSGYSLDAPEGILTNNGIVKSTTGGRLTYAGNRAVDIEIFKAITSVITNSYNLYAQSGQEPDIEQIMSEKQPIIYTDMHVRFMFGHLNFCTGKNSLRHYLKKNNIKNGSSTKVLKYSDMSGYIKENVERYFYEAYSKLGVTCEINSNNVETVNKVNDLLSSSLKNVIVVANRKRGVNTRVRVCSDSNIDINRLLATVEDRLNTGNSKSIKVKQIGEYENGVLDLNIIYNDKKYSQDALFAYQVIDILNEQGIKPSWDNVVLGKRDNGTIMTYNFKDRKNAVYALYAASGSGKGVMTLNLITSALADMCKLIYIDGKPDMGSVLADEAWKSGHEACVFNGVSGKGKEGLENRGTSIREDNPYMDEDNIPEGIFITSEEKRKFILITTYIRGIQLICELAAYRASMDLPSNDWVVSFVDECEQAAIAECDIIGILDRAEAARKGAKDSDGKKINLTNDDAYIFIQNYRQWLTIVASKFKTCVTSTFRYANMTTFFIWQSTKFPQQYERKSTIANVISASSGIITKIIGRGAAVNYGSSAFGTPTSLKDAAWYDERFSGRNGGYFAIGKDVQSKSMIVFRPFNVYSDADHKELIIENALAAGMTEDDLVGVSLTRGGQVIREVGFEGYANALLKQYDMTAAQQLNIGYEYVNNAVISLGLSDSLNHFMFNCHEFNCGSLDGTLQDEESSIKDNAVRKSFEINNITEDSEDNDDNNSVELEDTLDFGEPQEFTADEDPDSISHINNKPNRRIEAEYNNRVKVDNNRLEHSSDMKLNSIEVNSDGYVDETDNDALFVNKFIDKHMESDYGINYQFKRRFRYILDSIAKEFPNSSMIIRIGVLGDGSMLVNGRYVNTNKMTNNKYGIYMEDIVNFSEILRRFKFVKELILDEESIDWMVDEFGKRNTNINNAFAISRSLEKITIIDCDSNILKRIKRGDKSEDITGNVEFEKSVEQMSASYNNRVKEKGVGYNNRISSTCFGFTKNNWSRVKNNLSNSKDMHPIKGAFWIAAATITATIGGLAWTGGKVYNKFKK